METIEDYINKFQIGTRVRLNFYPRCEGVIIENSNALTLNKGMLISPRYIIKWDNPEHGKSKWLSYSDLHLLEKIKPILGGNSNE